MIQLYIVLALLILECVLVLVLLLPVNYSILRPLRFLQVLLARQLSGSTVKKVLLTVALILAFLVVESFQEMRYRENEDLKARVASGSAPIKVHDTVILKLNKFRSERNFYLTFFTFILLFIMLRLRNLTMEVYDLETRFGAGGAARPGIGAGEGGAKKID